MTKVTDPGKPEAGEEIDYESDGVRCRLYVGYADKGPECPARAVDLEAAGFVPASSLTATEARVKAWDRAAIITAIKAMTPGDRTLLLIDVVEDSSALGQMRRERDEASLLASEQRERAEALGAELSQANARAAIESASRAAWGERCRSYEQEVASLQSQLASERAGREQAVNMLHEVAAFLADAQYVRDDKERQKQRLRVLDTIERTPAPPSEAQGGKGETMGGPCFNCGRPCFNVPKRAVESPPASPPASDADGERKCANCYGPLPEPTQVYALARANAHGLSFCRKNCARAWQDANPMPASPPLPVELGPVDALREEIVAALRDDAGGLLQQCANAYIKQEYTTAFDRLLLKWVEWLADELARKTGGAKE